MSATNVVLVRILIEIGLQGLNVRIDSLPKSESIRFVQDRLMSREIIAFISFSVASYADSERVLGYFTERI